MSLLDPPNEESLIDLRLDLASAERFSLRFMLSNHFCLSNTHTDFLVVICFLLGGRTVSSFSRSLPEAPAGLAGVAFTGETGTEGILCL